VWGYGSGERREFYYGGVRDEEIDRLTTRWNGGGGTNAAFVVDLLERVSEHAQHARNSSLLFATASGLAMLLFLAWVTLLSALFVTPLRRVVNDLLVESYEQGWPGARFVLLLVSVCVAGAFGALMQTLRAMRDGLNVTSRRILLDGVLGIAAGFLTAALY